ncbi:MULTISPECIES: urea ABC transporter permease subunit UrtB [Ochrobactrum]|uniref:urea ABC transporter permease subunit UrtB n=1 Tax=Ochrobactrum sp. C6C9 TaxID=2736662 RepID=UPI00353049A0|nr:urea ABC transporter permease subunit UrtB [Ochrobactrum sp. C6C9]
MERRIRAVLLVMSVLFAALATTARADEFQGLVDALGKANFAQMQERISELAGTGDTRVVPVLNALGDGDLYARKSDGRVFITKASGANFQLTDPVGGEAAGEAPKAAMDKVKVNNSVRRAVRTALGGLTLMSPNRAERLKAAEIVAASADADALEPIEAALAKEQDDAIRALLEKAQAAALLASDRPVADKLKATQFLQDNGDRSTLSVLNAARANAQPELAAALDTAIGHIEQRQAFWDAGQNVWYGLSLGSVLLLAAIGLAITFGVMGIINMAHGEMVMLGAYVTFMVQEVIRTSYPGLFDWSLAIALPLAFLFTALVGLVIERGVIRFLYGRPLETLLATWGISLILQQAVRTVFGPTNREVGNPSWMSGAFELGGMTVTWNRLWIIVFSLAVFFTLLAVLKRSNFGLQMRAVTQNRRMASSMGIRTPYVDAFTFALGSGIAGMAGVALSQIDNVSPNLGQGYIIDSFMVVVFGGVGNLWGTLVGAFSLGILNKFLEPYAGAVLGKILVLVLIILFIQKRPRGLFALKGRAVEA